MLLQKILKTTVSTLVLVFVSWTPNARAGITGSVEIHNSRNNDITVTISRANGTVTDYIVRARSYRSIFVGDNAEGTTWLTAYDESGYELKREAASGQYSSYTWWVD